MDEQEVKAKIFYFYRGKLYNCMLNACKDGVNRFRGELCIHLYHALALLLCEHIDDAIKELEMLKSEHDYKLCAYTALAHAYRVKGFNDNLDSQIRECAKNSTSLDLFHTATVLFILKKYDKASEYIERAVSTSPTTPNFLALKGWIQLYLNKSENTSDLFESSLKDNRRNLDSSLGLAESLLREKNHEEAISVLNKVIVRFPSLNIALIQKMKLYFTMQNWDQCHEIMNRVLVMESDNIEALKVNIINLICIQAKYEEAAITIGKFRNRLDKIEPNNFSLLLENAQLFSRVCGRNELVLAETYKMIEKAVELTFNSSKFLTELGYQYYLQGRFVEAQRIYKSVTEVDDSSLDALMGMTYCDLLQNGKTEQVKHQIDLLCELQEGSFATFLLLMQAKFTNKHELSLRLLNEICERCLESIRTIPYGPQFLITLDPDFMITVVKELLLYVPQSSQLLLDKNKHQKTNPVAVKVEGILKVIVKACPGLQEALYLLSKVQFFNGDTVKAQSTLEQIFSHSDVVFGDGYLLMAQIQICTGQYQRATQNLEISLSHNFKVRDNPLYHFIAGVIDRNSGNIDDAMKCFTTALDLCNNSSVHISLADKASIYIELIDAHIKANQQHEAMKLIDTAKEEFRMTSEEARIVILNAEQTISKGDIQQAIDVLSNVKPSESYYQLAKISLANIFLEHRKDTKAYLKCYQELVDIEPNPDSFVLLGDAYLNVLEIEKALQTYSKALEMNPVDPYLTSKMGKALVDTHYFARAIAYYLDAIKLTDSSELKVQLTELYMSIDQFDNAEKLLNSEIDIENAKKTEDVTSLQYKSKLMIMLATIYEHQSNNLTAALKLLRSAKENQTRVIKRLSVEDGDVPIEETNALKDVCLKLSKLAIALKDNDGAVAYYKDALAVFPNDLLVLTDLAKLYVQMHNLELCQQTCAAILKLNPDNEDALVMMADIAFRKIDFDMASYHFNHLLTKQPTNWRALVKFIEVVRRTGELDEVPQYLQQAEQFCVKSSKDPGFCYCTALYQWYCGNLNAALRNFNNARSDQEWGKKAICNMIEICLNPDDEVLGEQFFDGEDSEYRDSRTMALKTADRLLRDLKQKSSGAERENFKYRILGNFLLLATKEKVNIERALEDFTAIASQDCYKEEIGPILGLAMAYTLLKQSQRAKNQLKRVSKTAWTFEDAEYLERCWILLADYYIQSSKYDLAAELLKRVLQHNKACTKAYELSGFIAEKEQVYKEAASYYDSTWKFGGKANPAVGYKLAYNFMKCKRYADAIDICQQVLKQHPEYPKIRKEILEKSLNNLRT